MSNVYVIVGPDFTGKHESLNSFFNKQPGHIQVIDEGAIIRGQQLESVPKNEMYRYGLISVVARSHLIAGMDVIAICDNLSIEALCLWRKMTGEHQAKCIIVLMEADQEAAMARMMQMNLPKEREQQMIHALADQFKRYDDLRDILTNKLNTIARDLADTIISEEEFLKSQED